jgi:hypothetical protein
MFLTNFVFITVISFHCFGLPWLPTVGGHFRPFTGVQNGNQCEVTTKCGNFFKPKEKRNAWKTKTLFGSLRVKGSLCTESQPLMDTNDRGRATHHYGDSLGLHELARPEPRPLRRWASVVHEQMGLARMERAKPSRPVRGRMSSQQPKSFYYGTRVTVPSNTGEPGPVWIIQSCLPLSSTNMSKLGPPVNESVPVQSVFTV